MSYKTFFISYSLLLTFSAANLFSVSNTAVNFGKKSSSLSAYDRTDYVNTKTIFRLIEKAEVAKNYVAAHDYDEKYCFFIDMRLPSGKNRFFVYNLETDSLEAAGLVSHGIGSETGTDELSFSNTPNSKSTSLGKYRIGKSYNGNFGLAYKLYGLDRTNSKAFDRSVVLHSYTGVPKDEVWPSVICKSEGCPTVSHDFLEKLKNYIDASDHPIMLWIYY